MDLRYFLKSDLLRMADSCRSSPSATGHGSKGRPVSSVRSGVGLAAKFNVQLDNPSAGVDLRWLSSSDDYMWILHSFLADYQTKP
ncbi:hypothetical protein FB106_11312 [Synechococcus sp. Ace-Pa]|nr:hypothetical protein FB106_11312 [Synechococcus sp. Ace-Pa]